MTKSLREHSSTVAHTIIDTLLKSTTCFIFPTPGKISLFRPLRRQRYFIYLFPVNVFMPILACNSVLKSKNSASRQRRHIYRRPAILECDHQVRVYSDLMITLQNRFINVRGRLFIVHRSTVQIEVSTHKFRLIHACGDRPFLISPYPLPPASLCIYTKI